MEPIRKLASRRILGRVLPSLKFFEPTIHFIRWMKCQYPTSIIYDVGAGLGHVSRALSEAGLKVLAIDLNYRESQDGFPVAIADGESYQYEPDSVVMLCRPCHGRFVEEVVSQALRCGATSILYVGLDRNVEGDLSVHREKFSVALSEAGQDGEKVWILRKPSESV